MSCSKYLLASIDNGFICCWNLLTCALEWRAKLDAAVLQADPLSENIAVFACLAGSSNLFVFKPNDSKPIYIQKNICREFIQWAVFVPRDIPESVASDDHQWLSKSQLYFLTESQDLICFSTKLPEERLSSLSKQLAVEESMPVTPFHLLLGKKRQQEQEKLDVESSGASTNNFKVNGDSTIQELLHTPAHVLPPASVLCTMFVNSFLIPKHSHSRLEKYSTDEDMESEKSDDSAEEIEANESHENYPSAISESTSVRLPKSQEKELRRIRKADYSWLCSL